MTDDALKDLKLALRLLYDSLLPDDNEDDARSAISRLLRNLREPVDSALRLILAALFDPKPATYFLGDGSPLERKIKLIGRGPGNPRQSGYMLKLADEVANRRFRHRRPLSRENAILAVAKKFKKSTRHVESAVKQYKNLYDPVEQSWARAYPEEVKRLHEKARAARAARASLDRGHGKKGLAPKRS
jgi:hypothetical protein